MEELNQNGFLILKNINSETPSDIKETINEKLDLNIKTQKIIMEDINYFDNFHRNIICYNKEMDVYPILSCYVCLGDTKITLIKNSHTKPVMNISSAISIFSNKKDLNLVKGDIIILYSTLIHRLECDSIMKMLNIFKNEDDYAKYSDKILNCKSSNQFHFSFDLIDNYLNYLNAATGYGYEYYLLPKNNVNEFDYISPENNYDRVKFSDDIPKNKIVILDEINNCTNVTTINYNSVEKNYFYYLLIILLLILFMVL
jgi:hypothetical protein